MLKVFMGSFAAMLGFGVACIVLFIVLVILERADSALRERREKKRAVVPPSKLSLYLGDITEQVRKEMGKK